MGIWGKKKGNLGRKILNFQEKKWDFWMEKWDLGVFGVNFEGAGLDLGIFWVFLDFIINGNFGIFLRRILGIFETFLKGFWGIFGIIY